MAPFCGDNKSHNRSPTPQCWSCHDACTTILYVLFCILKPRLDYQYVARCFLFVQGAFCSSCPPNLGEQFVGTLDLQNGPPGSCNSSASMARSGYTSKPWNFLWIKSNLKLFNQNGFIGGMVRSQNRAEAIEISGRRYLDAYKCLNLMSTRPYFEDAFKTCGDFAFSPLDFVFFCTGRMGKLAWVIVPKWHVSWMYRCVGGKVWVNSIAAPPQTKSTWFTVVP